MKYLLRQFQNLRLKYLMVILFALCLLGLGFKIYYDIFQIPENEKIEEKIKSFLLVQEAVVEINFSELYGRKGQFQVLHPILDRTKWSLLSSKNACDDSTDMDKTKKPSINETTSEPFRSLECSQEANQNDPTDRIKNEMLHHFIKGDSSLPDNFITMKPLVDRWGKSYAHRLSQSGVFPYNTSEWITQNLSFFKPSELSEVIEQYKIVSGPYAYVSMLNDSEIVEIIKGSPLIITKNHLYIKNQSRLGFSPLSYWVFDFNDWKKFLKNQKYELTSFKKDSRCLETIGNACWTFNSNHAMAYLYQYALGIFILVMGIGVVLLVFYFKYQREKWKEEQKRKLALQVLSHEFRTPVSSMLLMMEQLVPIQNSLNIESQDLMMRLSSEVFKLQRIIEISKTYLQTQGHKIHFNPVSIPSINFWVGEFIETYTEEGVVCEYLTSDVSIYADAFWLRFILSSLLQNSLHHGKKPIFIRLKSNEKSLIISVEDQGQCEFKTLAEMTNPFVKRRGSHGMGLGLNIIQFIVDELKAQLSFESMPTRFNLVIKFSGSR